MEPASADKPVTPAIPATNADKPVTPAIPADKPVIHVTLRTDPALILAIIGSGLAFAVVRASKKPRVEREGVVLVRLTAAVMYRRRKQPGQAWLGSRHRPARSSVYSVCPLTRCYWPHSAFVQQITSMSVADLRASMREAEAKWYDMVNETTVKNVL